MTDGKKWVSLLLIVLVAVPGVWLVAQESNEDSALVGEEMVLEDAISGDLTLDEPAVVEEELVEEELVEEEVLAEEPLVEEIAEEMPLELEEKGAEGLSVEEIAEEVDKADIVIEEVVEEAALEEAVVEEMAEEVIEEAVDEVVAGDMTEEVEEEVIEEIVEEAVLEEAVVEEMAEEEVVEEVVAGDMTEEVAEEIIEEVNEDAAVEEVAIEEMAGEIIEDVVAGDLVDEIDEDVSLDNLDDSFGDAVPVALVMEEIPAPVVNPQLAADEMLNDAIEDVVAAEALKRMAYKKHAVETLGMADKALDNEKYKEARTLYESTEATLDKIGRRDEDKKIRQNTKKGLANTLYEWALSLQKQRDLEAANQMARQAAVAGHPKAVALIGEIAEERKDPKPPPPPKDIVRWKETEYVEAKTDIAKRLRKGRQFYMGGEFGKATQEFEGILKRDPYNTEAIRMLQKTSNKREDISTMEFRATRASMLKDVQDSWNPRVYALNEESATDPTGIGTPTADSDTSDRIMILDKMKAIMIPEIEFHQANIHDVIELLQQSSREFDTVKDENKKGVNIILNIGDNASGIADDAPSSDDPFADTAGAGDAASSGGVPLITFSARHISLLEALKIVTKVSNLKYRVEDSVVMILPWDAPDGDIIVRMYNVLPSVEERLTSVSSELGSSAQGNNRDSGGFTAMEGASLDSAGANWKEAFGEMGVKWPNDSSIKYVSAMGKLVVANTADNLTVFERVLSELNVVPSQIEIESRFVEVGQKDLDALGFEWGLTDDWEVAQQKASAGAPLSGRQRIVVEEGSFSAGNRFLTAGTEMGGIAIADNILSIAGVLTNPELKVVLHALDQKGSTDLLSAPKVLTQSGAEATIKVVTEYIYPTDFEVTEVTGTGLNGETIVIGGIVEPSEFETREVGVILTVLPEVSPEGQMINLTMTPQVVSDPVWKNYGTTYTDQSGNKQQLSMEQPFFFTRSISTSIAVYNGATVVMGGMITEKHNEVNDRIPILGDIPLIGRLFQSNYESSEKRNLLIFVTARLVDPAGRPIKETNLSNL